MELLQPFPRTTEPILASSSRSKTTVASPSSCRPAAVSSMTEERGRTDGVPAAVPGRLELVDDLAGAAHRDRGRRGDVLHPGVRGPVEELHDLDQVSASPHSSCNRASIRRPTDSGPLVVTTGSWKNLTLRIEHRFSLPRYLCKESYILPSGCGRPASNAGGAAAARALPVEPTVKTDHKLVNTNLPGPCAPS